MSLLIDYLSKHEKLLLIRDPNLYLENKHLEAIRQKCNPNVFFIKPHKFSPISFVMH